MKKYFLCDWYCDIANLTWFNGSDFAMESCIQITNISVPIGFLTGVLFGLLENENKEERYED